MRGNVLAGLIPVGIAVVLAISLASCGQSSSSASPGGSSNPAPQPTDHGLTVTPSTGGPRTTFSLRFIAPASSQRMAHSKIGFTLGLAGPPGIGCIGSRSVELPAAIKGDPVPITLDPARLGGAWCVGTFKARVLELGTPVCGAGTMCPQFVRVIGTVGKTTFRVLHSG